MKLTALQTSFLIDAATYCYGQPKQTGSGSIFPHSMHATVFAEEFERQPGAAIRIGRGFTPPALAALWEGVRLARPDGRPMPVSQ